MAIGARKANKILSDSLRNLANSAEDSTPDGEILTKADKLAQIVWDHAIGHTYVNAKGERKRVLPCTWAIQLIFDRLEGRVIASMDDIADRPKPVDRISKLTVDRCNKLVESINKKKKNGSRQSKTTRT